ncbi:MAG: YbaB/EbfC family nucleoid-associated protein [Planctomycetia bacterium]|nr:YbaB/EbfC family nucleoid-associated protein [Planctomycetia bacterium]
MFDSLKTLSQLGPMLSQAREMQTKMAEVQRKLGTIRAEGTAADGMITVTANGLMEIVDIRFLPDISRQETAVLADLTRAAVNQALSNVRMLVQREMQSVTGDMDLSGLQKMIGMPS